LFLIVIILQTIKRKILLKVNSRKKSILQQLMDGPLKNLLVIDLTRVLVGPYCTMILSDLGARVIKVEAPETGDDSRKFGPFINDYSAYFMSLNRGKESIALNLKNSDDKKIFDKILSKADILVENFKPGTLERWGFGWKEVNKKYPKLIYASASGFGQTGPLKELPAYDMVVQGMGGLMSVTGQPNSEPTRVGTSIGDITAALFTAIGINAALYDRQKTGKGMFVDVSMLDCQIAILENAIARYLSKNEIPKPMGSRHPSIAPFEAFKTKDNYIIIAAGNDKLFEKLCNVLKLNEAPSDPKFKTNSSRAQNMDELKKIIEEKLSAKNTSMWIQEMEKEKIPCGPIFNIKEAVENPQIESRNMIVKAYHKVIGDFKLAGNPIKLSTYKDEKTRGDIPDLDEHREKIIKEFAK
jgi:CoA:oxalate CoA-transferase